MTGEGDFTTAVRSASLGSTITVTYPLNASNGRAFSGVSLTGG